MWKSPVHYIPGVNPASRWAQLRCDDGCHYRYYYDPNLHRADALNDYHWTGTTSNHTVTLTSRITTHDTSRRTPLCVMCYAVYLKSHVNQTPPIRTAAGSRNFDKQTAIAPPTLQLPPTLRVQDPGASRKERQAVRVEMQSRREKEAVSGGATHSMNEGSSSSSDPQSEEAGRVEEGQQLVVVCTSHAGHRMSLP
jgi:hypothetical protein